MLEKVRMQRTQRSSQLYRRYQKNPVKCSACVVSQKLRLNEKNCTIGNTPRISRESLIKIWQENTLGNQ